MSRFFNQTNATLLVGVALLSAGTVLAFLNNLGGAALAYAAGAICLVIVNASKFAVFKGFGIEARMREVLDEASSLIPQLRHLARLTVANLLTLSARSGRVAGHYRRAERMQLLEDSTRSLRDLGFKEEEIASIRGPFDKTIMCELFSPVYRRTQQLLNEKEQLANQRLQAVQQPTRPDDPEFRSALAQRELIITEKSHLENLLENTGNEIANGYRDLIARSAILSESEKRELSAANTEELADFVLFATEKRLRRPEVFYEGDK